MVFYYIYLLILFIVCAVTRHICGGQRTCVSWFSSSSLGSWGLNQAIMLSGRYPYLLSCCPDIGSLEEEPTMSWVLRLAAIMQ